MRAKFLLIPTISVLGLSLILQTTPAAADDVFVDLSVLDSLGENNSPVINSGPLFPVVKKTEVKKSPAKVKAVNKKSKKAAAKKAVAKVTIPPKAEVKVEVRHPQVETREQAEETQKKSVVSADAVAELNDSPFAAAPVEPAKEEVSAAPVAPIEIKSEPSLDKDKAPVVMERIDGATPLPNAEKETVSPQLGEGESLFDIDEPSETASKPAIPFEKSASDKQPVYEKASLPAPIPLGELENPAEQVSKEIIFSADGYELSAENKIQLDKLVASFENPQMNKIAIFAFNIDDGKDVFRKKRLSLNRAIEVRSYLLGKGYKNYSIKVVNLEEADGKENKVLVEELK